MGRVASVGRWVVVGALLARLSAVGWGQELFVSPSGNDAYDGSQDRSAGDGRQGPFKTLARARDAARGLLAIGDDDPVIVTLRGGVYTLTEPLVLTARDSGTAKRPVVWRAMEGEQPVISGGRMIAAKWEKFQGEIVRTKVKGAGVAPFQLLRVGDEWAVRARTPNFDSSKPFTGGWAFLRAVAGVDSRKGFGFDAALVAGWKATEGLEMHVFPGRGWVNSIEPIATLDAERGVASVAGPGAADELRPGNRFYFENAMAALDSPGEWYLDAATEMLYYWPAGNDYASKPMSAPAMDRLLHIKGTVARPAGGIQFSGLTFMDTSYTPRLSDPYLPPDAAIWLDDADDCVFEKCRVTRVGGSGFKLLGESRRNKLLECTVDHVGQSGVTMVGAGTTFPSDNVVAGCRITDIGLVYKHVAGVYIAERDPALAQAPGNTVAHNLIRSCPRYGVSLKMNQGNNVVEYNEVRRTNQETCDTGGIESCIRNEDAPGNTFRCNLVVDSVGLGTAEDGTVLTPYYSWGIYLDDNSSNATVFGNVCVRNVRGGIMVHGGKDNVIENNVLVDSAQQNLELVNIGTSMRGNRLLRNVFYLSKPTGSLIGASGWTADVLAECDQNLYYAAGGADQMTFLGKPLAEWQAMGYDGKCIVSDPLFVDAPNDDYCLRMGSPIFKTSFQNIKVCNIGVSGYQRGEYVK